MATITIEDYSWVEPTYSSHQSAFVQGKEMSFVPLEIRISFDWEILLVPAEKRTFHMFEWCYIPFYTCIFQDLGIRLPLTSFEKEVFDHLCISHSHFHPWDWGFV